MYIKKELIISSNILNELSMKKLTVKVLQKSNFIFVAFKFVHVHDIITFIYVCYPFNAGRIIEGFA